jgi:DNA-binding SARP family transcriptional activator
VVLQTSYIPVSYRVLGPVAAFVNDMELPLGRRLRRLLLSFLLLHPNQIVLVDRLIDGLWSGDPPARARASLQNVVGELRALLGRANLETCLGGYRLRLEAEDLDAAVFERLHRQALDEPPAARIHTLELALELWAGDPYQDAFYDDFAQAEIFRLRECRLLALEDLYGSKLAVGEVTSILPGLLSLVSLHPYRERFRTHLMTALDRAGRTVEALRSYEHYRVLLEEWNAQPSASIASVAETIRNRSAA